MAYLNPTAGAARETPTTTRASGAGYGPFTNAGVPASGYLNGTAEKGALVIDTTNGTLYQNTGTKAATVWTAR